MSVFVKSLRTFESDVTGETKDYKINNAVWLLLKSKYKLTQTEWAVGYGKEEVLFGARFIVCVLKANGLDTTEKEVLENTDAVDIMNFIVAYQTAMMSDENNNEEQEEDEEGK